jgi:glutamine synthetase
VDLRFTDTKGKEQHVTVPTSKVDEDLFEDGKMFDGSSIAGWKSINESDMILMPDRPPPWSTRSPRTPRSTSRCDVVEPSTMQGYERDPRSLRQARRGLPQVHRHRRRGLLRAGERVLHFRRRALGFRDEAASPTRSTPPRRLELREDYPDGNLGHRPTIKGGYFPVPPVDSLHDIRSAMCLALEEMGLDPRCITTRSRPPASARSASPSTRW